MKARVILAAVLVVAIALVGCTQAQPAPKQEAVSGGQEVAAGTTRLFTDPQKSNLAFEIEQNGRVYQGTVQQGQTILFFDGTTIFRGANSTGEKLFTVEGDRIFVGGSSAGPIAYTVQAGRVFEGDEKGPVVYTIEGERVFQGANTTGNIVFQSGGEITGNVQFLIPILADQRF